ncbi:hypothetical protein C5167_030333 [Papaver somniferum]|nr:hypothetical protein C5167_030333 [Papaver somniferum]
MQDGKREDLCLEFSMISDTSRGEVQLLQNQLGVCIHELAPDQIELPHTYQSCPTFKTQNECIFTSLVGQQTEEVMVMEACKERKEQLGHQNEDEKGTSSSMLDPTTKMLIQESIVSTTGRNNGQDNITGDGDGGNKGVSQKPGDVLVFKRSVNKIDSSLE